MLSMLYKSCWLLLLLVACIQIMIVVMVGFQSSEMSVSFISNRVKSSNAMDDGGKVIVFEIARKHTKEDIQDWLERVEMKSPTSRWTIWCDSSMCTQLVNYQVIRPHESCTVCAKYRYLERLLTSQKSVFLCPITTHLIEDPFKLGDSGVVALTSKQNHSIDRAIGRDYVYDDPNMGWSRYMHAFEISHVATDILLLHADAVHMVSRVRSCLLGRKGGDESACLTEALFRPSTTSHEAPFSVVGRRTFQLLDRSDTIEMLGRVKGRCTPPSYQYHVLLHAMNGTYQKWQTIVAWDALLRLSRQPCSPIGNMTRIISGESDDLMEHIPTFQTDQLPPFITNKYPVVNRPWALSKWLQHSKESEFEYVLILEPDHLIKHPVPCDATPDVALASVFHYMRLNFPLRALSPLAKKTGLGTVCDLLKARNLIHQCDFNVGAPSPLLIHRGLLHKYVAQWYALSIRMMKDAQVMSALGWVLEMWAFAITFKRHVVVKTLHQEPSIQHHMIHDDTAPIMHYTFKIGSSKSWQFDKHRFMYTFPSILYPPKEMLGMDPAGYELVRRLNRGMQSPWVLGLWEKNDEPSNIPSIAWREVLMVLCNRNAIGKLYLWANQVIRAGVHNWVVVCLDQHTVDVVSREYGVEHVDARVHFAQEKSNSHSISALKYQVAVQYLKRNCAVLLSDVDVIVLQNPFNSKMLVRDSDVEGMTDGFDACSAYGCITAEASTWKRPHSDVFRIAHMNVGWIYLRPTSSTIRLLEQVGLRVKQLNVWDQAEFNNELWKPSAPIQPGSVEYMLGMDSRRSSACRIRIIPRDVAVNSKFWFSSPSSPRALYRSAVVVHVNYHQDKLNRMKAVIKQMNNVHTDHILRRHASAYGDIAIAVTNRDRVDFAISLHRQMKGLHLVFGAYDDEAAASLKRHKMPYFLMEPFDQLPPHELRWGGSEFHRLGKLRARLLLRCLRLGLTTFVLDTDVAVLRNPYFYIKSLKRSPDVIVSSDILTPSSTKKEDDAELERDGRFLNTGLNIGLMYWRNTTFSLEIATRWVARLEASPKVWDQTVFGRMVLQMQPQERQNVGVFPVTLFTSGHTYFISKLPQSLGIHPYIVHLTFQWGGGKGKRHRLRESMLWAADSPEYYGEPNKFLTVEADHTLEQYLYTLPIDDFESMLHAHVRLANRQLSRIRKALAIARLLHRILILPKTVCVLDRYWANNKGVTPGSPAKLPIGICPADNLIAFEDILQPETTLRESSFLSNPRTPRSTVNSKIDADLRGIEGDSAKVEHILQYLSTEHRVLNIVGNLPMHNSTLDAKSLAIFERTTKRYPFKWCCHNNKTIDYTFDDETIIHT